MRSELETVEVGSDHCGPVCAGGAGIVTRPVGLEALKHYRDCVVGALLVGDHLGAFWALTSHVAPMMRAHPLASATLTASNLMNSLFASSPDRLVASAAVRGGGRRAREFEKAICAVYWQNAVRENSLCDLGLEVTGRRGGAPERLPERGKRVGRPMCLGQLR